MTKIEAKNVYQANYGWLKTKLLFSFSNYHDPKNLEFGHIRVWNDDVVEPHNWFPMHYHQDFEIVTLMLDWTITHKDTMWTHWEIHGGEIQAMSTGTGVQHSEFNLHESPAHLFQLWFYPTKMWLTPSYHQWIPLLNNNALNLLVVEEDYDIQQLTDDRQQAVDSSIYRINSKVRIFRGIFDAGQKFDYTMEMWDKLMVYVKSWQIQIDEEVYNVGDQARLVGNKFSFAANSDSDFVLIETV